MKSMKPVIPILTGLLSVVLLIAVACTGTAPTQAPLPTNTPAPTATARVEVATPTPGPTPTPAAPETLKIGVSLPLTGPTGTQGTAILRGFEMYASDLNGSGGFTAGNKRYVIKYVTYDDKGSAADGVTVGNKLIFEDKVSLVLGPALSAPAASSKALYEENKVFRLNSAAAVSGHGPYSFLFYPNVDTYYPAVWKQWGKVQPGALDRVAIINPNNATGQAFKVQAETVAKILGVNVVWSKLYETNISDFTPVLADLLASKPTFIDTSFTLATQMGTVVQRLRELGYNGAISTVQLVSPQDLLNVAKAENVEGFVYQGPTMNVPEATPAQREFYDKYIRLYGLPFYSLTPDHYVAAQIMIEGIKKAGSTDATKVRDAVATLEFESLMGRVKFIQEVAAGQAVPGTFCGMIPRRFSQITKAGGNVPWYTESLEEVIQYAELMRK